MGTSILLEEYEIVSIKYVGKRQTIDITTDGNNLFFANDILTHNSGFSQSDVGLDNTSESFALPGLADLFLAITQTDELKEMGQYLVKQLKNRFGSIDKFTRFVIGVEKSKMRIFDVDQGNIISSSAPIEASITPLPAKDKLKEKFLGFN